MNGGRHHRVTLILIVLILALAWNLVSRQRQEQRLRTALAFYKNQSHGKVIDRLRGPSPALDWPDDSPLTEVIEQIKLCTKSGWPAFPLGIPVVVDPVGLQQAGKSLSSTVARPPADDEVSLGQKLRRVLEPLGLGYQVKDASLVITSKTMAMAMESADAPDVDKE